MLDTPPIPRSVNDRGQIAEVITGIGDQLSSKIEKMDLNDANFDRRKKGHVQYLNYARQDDSMDSLKHGVENHGMEAALGEKEEQNQEALLERSGDK